MTLRTRRRALAAALLAAAALVAFLLSERRDEPEPLRYPTAPADAATARVERVVDGDTIRLAGIGPVRLIGVDTPETYGARVECFGPEATRYVRRLLPRGGRVRYVVGREPRDRYGRLLVYLYLPNDLGLSHMLLRGGYATVLTVPPNDRYVLAFQRAEREARRARSGMWSRPGCAG